MRRFFTKQFLLMLLGFAAIDVMGQNYNTFTITSPASIAGDYPLVGASFGLRGTTVVSGSLGLTVDGTAPTSDGCSALTNDLTGKIGLVDRGTCSFDAKSLNVQNAGAITVIICQNSADAPIAAGVATAAVAAQVNVPVGMISQANCNKIKASLAAGEVQGSINFKCVPVGPAPTYPANTVWGNNVGEGDFNGGLNDWTPLTDNGWAWYNFGYITGGPYGGAMQTTMPTSCDGIIAFNHDLAYNDGNGTCTEEDCFAGIISPNITFSTPVSGLVLEFSQALYNFGSDHLIITSKDGGLTWPDTTIINAEYGTFNFTFSERVRVGLCGYEGASQVRVQFAMNGNFYYWGIDDVILLNETVADTKINRNFYAAAPALKTPVSQVSEMPFVADVANRGNADAKDTNLDVIIKNSSETEVARVTNNYGNLASCSELQNKVFANTITPPATEGWYSGAYEISSAGETLNTDNSAPFYFGVTSNTFGTMLSETEWGAAYMRYIFTNFVDGISGNPYYSVGNAYYMPKGKGYKATNVRFGLANTAAAAAGALVKIDLFEWNDANNDNRSTAAERTLVGANFVEVPGTGLRNIEFPLLGVDENGTTIENKEVLLKDNTQYLVMVHSDQTSSTKLEFLGHTPRVFNEDQQSMYYGGVNLAYDSLGINRASGTFFNWEAGTESDDPSMRDFYKTNSFNLSGTIAYVELDIDLASSTYDINSSATVNVFPNPASKELYIDLTLENVNKEVRVELVSMDGKSVLSKSFSGIQDSRLKLEVSDLIAGTYSALIHTDNGVITKKVVIQK